MGDEFGAAATWDSFCDELKTAGRVLGDSFTALDPIDVAEGHRYLTRLLRMGLDLTLESVDAAHPELVPAQGRTIGDGGNTADCVYLHAVVDGSATYRLHGPRGTAPLFEIGLYAGKIGLSASSRRVDAVTERELLVDDAGEISVSIGPAASGSSGQCANHLSSEPDADYVFIRQYAHDWDRETPAQLILERTDANDDRSVLTIEQVQSSLHATAAFVHDAAAAWASVVDGVRAGPANVIIPTPHEQDMTMPSGHRFATGSFDLGADEALMVEFTPIEVPYWGLTITNHWFEPLDYASTGSHLNNETATIDADGRVRIALSRSRPGIANWIDTRGHRGGTVIFRWSRTDAPLPEITTRVVALHEVRAP